MRAIRMTLTAVLLLGLLAGSSMGTLAQDEETEETAQDVVFAMLMSLRSRTGEHTPIGDIPAGTVTVDPGGMSGPEGINVTYTLDPAPPGGDTFKITENGPPSKGTFDAGPGYGPSRWFVQPAFGTGLLEGLTGKGRSFQIGDAEAGTIHVFFTGTIEMPTGEMAEE